LRLVGLSGYARSGKDEAAKVLVEAGWERIAFADKLRQMLYEINPIIKHERQFNEVLAHQDEEVVSVFYSDNVVRLQTIIDYYGWDGYKSTPYGEEIRALLQRLGTEGGRKTLWDSIWVDAALNDLKQDGLYVVTDCRFPNEAGAIKDRGGMVVRITRAGVGPANSHASETSLDDWKFDSFIRNDGSLEEFHDKVRRAFT